MKNYILLILASCLFVCNSYAQSPSFRDSGYMGSISYTNRLLIMSGVETSHGLIAGNRHYFGCGAGVFFLPIDGMTKIYSDAFVDYHAYLKDKKSTPVIGMKIGYLHNCNNPSEKYQDANGLWLHHVVDGFTYNHDAIEITPGFAWSWAIRPKLGLTAGLYADLYVYRNPDITTVILPKISLGIEF